MHVAISCPTAYCTHADQSSSIVRAPDDVVARPRPCLSIACQRDLDQLDRNVMRPRQRQVLSESELTYIGMNIYAQQHHHTATDLSNLPVYIPDHSNYRDACTIASGV
jgi:hypothetical protein